MILTASKLTKLYKNGRGAEDVTFTLSPGEIFGLLGPNGSGKTTVMKACVGLTPITHGAAEINGFDITSKRKNALRSVGVLVENPALYPRMTAAQNLKQALAFYNDLPLSRIDEVLRVVELSKYANDRVSSFSLGMRQRLGIALALLNNPELLILDEPANGLDIEGMVGIREIIKDAAKNGAAVMISSHLAHEIEIVATKVGIMYDGRLLNVITMEEALTDRASLEDYFLSEVSRYRKSGVSI